MGEIKMMAEQYAVIDSGRYAVLTGDPIDMPL